MGRHSGFLSHRCEISRRGQFVQQEYSFSFAQPITEATFKMRWALKPAGPTALELASHNLADMKWTVGNVLMVFVLRLKVILIYWKDFRWHIFFSHVKVFLFEFIKIPPSRRKFVYYMIKSLSFNKPSYSFSQDWRGALCSISLPSLDWKAKVWRFLQALSKSWIWMPDFVLHYINSINYTNWLNWKFVYSSRSYMIYSIALNTLFLEEPFADYHLCNIRCQALHSLGPLSPKTSWMD